MAQSTKNPGDRRYSDESLDPEQQEWNALISRPDMQAFDDQVEASLRDEANNDASEDDGLFDKLANRRGDRLDAKNAATADRRAAEQKEWDAAAQLMSPNRKGDQKGNQKNTQDGGGGFFNKKNAIRGGIAGGTIGIALVIFGFLSPFKLPALMQVVTDVTGQRVEQITTHRAKVILARAILSRFGTEGAVVTGKGPVSSLIATLRTNRFEDTLKQALAEKGVNYETDGKTLKLSRNGKSLGTFNSKTTESELLKVFDGDEITKKVINDLVKEKIPTWRFFKRAKFASWLRLKYNIPKFGTKKSTETDKEKKLADIQEDRLNGRYGQYADNLVGAIECVMGESSCPVDDPSKAGFVEKLRDSAGKKASAVKDAVKTAVQEQTKIIVNDTTKAITAKIYTKVVDQFIKKFAVKAIPIIGWIDLAATLDHVAWEFAENDYMAKVPAYYRAISYAQMYGEWIGYGDQAKAGDMDNDVMAMLTSQLDGAETSQAFNYIQGDSSRGTAVKVRVDENNPSLVKQVWEQYKTTPSGWYSQYVSHPVMNAYYYTIGGGGLLGALGDFAGSLISKGFAFVTSWVPETWTEAIQAYMSDVFGKLFIAIGMSADPLDQGADWFNDVYAGGDVSFNTYCKEMGCRKLTNEQIASSDQSIAAEKANDIKNKGWAYALFSPDATQSVTNQLAMTLPSSLSLSNLNLTDGLGQLASIIANTPGRLFGGTTKADEGFVNLNNTYQYGALISEMDADIPDESINGDPCPAIEDGKYNNCNWTNLTAQAMQCPFIPESDACDFMTASSAEGNFAAMSYNILGAGHNNDGGIDWRTRLNNVVKTVTEKNPDTIGFQEVSGGGEQRVALHDKLTGYDGFPIEGDGEKDGASRPIYWNKAKFKLAASGTYQFPRYDNGDARFPWVKLTSINYPSGYIYVFNTHLAAGGQSSSKYNTVGGYKPPEARKMEAGRMMEQAQEIVAKNEPGKDPKTVPIIMTGDYNSTCDTTSRDGSMNKDEIPCNIYAASPFQFKDSGLTAAAAGNVENYNYSTSHGHVGNQVKKGESTVPVDENGNGIIDPDELDDMDMGRHIDHVFYTPSIVIGSWENIINDTTKEASDHTPVFVGLNVPGMGATSAGSDTSNEAPSTLGYSWPVTEGDYKGLSNCYAKPGHTGIDLTASVGTKVRAAKAGTVAKVDPAGSSDGGKYIIIKHDDGHWTNYQHNSKLLVSEGDSVTAGQVIALSGNTGYSTGPHIHFSVTTQQGLDSRGSVAYSLNPLDFLPKDRSEAGCSQTP